jgi:hypothetical protein
LPAARKSPQMCDWVVGPEGLKLSTRQLWSWQSLGRQRTEI